MRRRPYGHDAGMETGVTSNRRTTDIVERVGTRPILVIGLGGIGVPVADALARFLTFAQARTTMFLVDGDWFEERNRSRILFESGGNKALVKSKALATTCDGQLAIVPVPKFVTPRNVHRVIDDGSIVFLAVDNHATRLCVSERCRKVTQALLISGGNDAVDGDRDGTFGNVMVYERERGRDVSSPLTRFHPEIARPADKRPDQLGCAERSESAPQLLFTNLAVASAMLGAFYAWLSGRLEHEEVFLDIVQARMNPVKRAR
jgi:ThiF family